MAKADYTKLIKYIKSIGGSLELSGGSETESIWNLRYENKKAKITANKEEDSNQLNGFYQPKIDNPQQRDHYKDVLIDNPQKYLDELLSRSDVLRSFDKPLNEVKHKVKHLSLYIGSFIFTAGTLYLNFGKTPIPKTIVNHIAITIIFALLLYVLVEIFPYKPWKSKIRRDKVISSTIFIIVVVSGLYLIVTFVTSPNVCDNFSRFFQTSTKTEVSPTKEVVTSLTPDSPEHTLSVNPTGATPTNEPIKPTITPTPTEKHPNNDIKIGIFSHQDCSDEKNQNASIIKAISDLKFTVEEIPIIPIQTAEYYHKFDVIYIPFGWSCKQSDYEFVFEKIDDILTSGTTGLLVGDPDVDERNDATLSPFHPLFYFGFEPFSKSNTAVAEPVWTGYISFSHSFYHVFNHEDKSSFPKAGSLLSYGYLTNNTEIPVRMVFRSSYPYSLSLVVPKENDDWRYAIMPGGELGAASPSIGEYHTARLLRWLAGKELNPINRIPEQ